MSQAFRHRYTRTLAGGWIMRAMPPALSVTPRDLPRRRFAAGPPWSAPVPWSLLLQPLAEIFPSPPTRSSWGFGSEAAFARSRRTVLLALAPHRIALQKPRSAPALRSAPANPHLFFRPCVPHSLSSWNHYAGWRTTWEEGFIGRLRWFRYAGAERFFTVPRHQIIRLSGLSTLQKNIVIRVRTR